MRDLLCSVLLRSTTAHHRARELSDMLSRVDRPPAPLSIPPALDAIDLRLLVALGSDARASVTDLAVALGLSRNTVQAHLARIERGGLLGFASALAQVTAAGFPLTAFVIVDIAQAGFPATAAALAEIPEVLEAHGTTGDGDLWCRVVARDGEDLGRVLDAIGSCPGVDRTRTTLAIRTAVPFRTGPLLQREA
jgi:DNA-binding Lrp family transcriptional regulator